MSQRFVLTSEELRARLIAEFAKAVDSVMTEIIVVEQTNPGDLMYCQLVFTAGNSRVVMSHNLEMALNVPASESVEKMTCAACLACSPQTIKQMVKGMIEAGDAVGLSRNETAEAISQTLASEDLPLNKKARKKP